MTTFSYTLVSNGEGERNISVFIPGELPLVAASDHPNFERIVEIAVDGANAEGVADLFDVTTTLARHFTRLSERVTAAHGRLFLDGDEVANALTRQVLRFLDEDVDDWRPLVAFFEKVQANPNDHSRAQLYTWLDAKDFTIDEEGDIVAYKGVNANLTSVYEGEAIVNGHTVTGHIPNAVGAVVEMPRTAVAHDPDNSCSTGLHAGSASYARTWGQVLLEVRVNPRDVVSVPTGTEGDKFRCCRYRVVGRDAVNCESALRRGLASFENADPSECCDDCGEYIADCDC